MTTSTKEDVMSEIVARDVIEGMIYMIRGRRVMIDRHLAKLYEVSTKALNQAVTRNADRFPEDFMFRLNDDDIAVLKSQFVTLRLWRFRRAKPRAFTEQGVAMLSSVLNSRKAVHVNIAIMRAVVRLREALSINKELIRKLNELERHVGKHDDDILLIFEAIRKLMEPAPEKPRYRIGFRPPPKP